VTDLSPELEARLAEVADLSGADLVLDVEALLDSLLDRIRGLLDVDTAAVLLVDTSGTGLVATAARGLEEEVRQGVSVPLSRGFAGRIAATRRPVVLDRVDATTVVNPILIDKGIKAMAGVPLIDGGRVVGVLHVGSLAERRFTDGEIQLLQRVAERVTLATGSRLARMERDAAVSLQRGLLPAKLPEIVGLSMAARYVPGGGSAVGGDWYDVFTLPFGGLGIVIGDVSGHGLHAAIIMGRLRSALRAYALESDDPADVLTRLNRKLVHFEPGEMATVLYARVDPSFELLHVSSAGHLPPVLVADDGAEVVDLDIDPPIGVGIRARRRTTTVPFPPSTRVCLFTDGLVERRGEHLDVGYARLLDAVTPSDANLLTARIMAALVGTAMLDDDVALLTVERLPMPDGPLELNVRAEPRSLTGLRSAVRRYLDHVGVAPDTREELVVAIGEATTNVVEHAYGPDGGDLGLRIERVGDTVVATVTDHGRWRSPRGTDRGRGTAIIRHLGGELAIETGDEGTRLTITKQLPGGS
jgi:anti-sigma regulatory factor (Ser/Thr protein kinase)